VKASPPEAVESNTFFRRALEAARSIAQSADRLLDLVEEATRKLDAAESPGPLTSVLADAGALFRMIRACAKRTYTATPWESLVLAVAALVYFVSPIDLIPDPIPVIGYIDDAAVIAFVALSIRSDLDNFRKWEAQSKEGPDGETST